MKPIEIFIYGEPVPKKRPRFTKNGGVYTPKETRDAEELLGNLAKTQNPDADLPLLGPVRVIARFWSQSTRDRVRGRHDLDNLVKLIDGLNKIVWKDDSQIEEIRASIVRDADTPRTYIRVEPITEPRRAGKQ